MQAELLTNPLLGGVFDFPHMLHLWRKPVEEGYPGLGEGQKCGVIVVEFRDMGSSIDQGTVECPRARMDVDGLVIVCHVVISGYPLKAGHHYTTMVSGF